MGIRTTKKIMKNSSGFFTLGIRGEECLFCVNESMVIEYHKKGITCDYEYFPYKSIRRIIDVVKLVRK